MIDRESNPHRVRERAFQVSYWSDGCACGRAEAEIARIEVAWGCLEAEFRLPEGRADLDRMMVMLNEAFVLGEQFARKQIRDALGVKAPRQ